MCSNTVTSECGRVAMFSTGEKRNQVYSTKRGLGRLPPVSIIPSNIRTSPSIIPKEVNHLPFTSNPKTGARSLDSSPPMSALFLPLTFHARTQACSRSCPVGNLCIPILHTQAKCLHPGLKKVWPLTGEADRKTLLAEYV